MDRALQQFIQANAIAMAAQNDLQFMWLLWMQAVGAEGDVGEESGQGGGYLKDPGLDCMKTSWEIY